MHFSRFLSIFCVVCILSMIGCGASNEPTTMDASEVQRYVEENEAALAEEDALADAEEAEDDDDD